MAKKAFLWPEGTPELFCKVTGLNPLTLSNILFRCGNNIRFSVKTAKFFEAVSEILHGENVIPWEVWVNHAEEEHPLFKPLSPERKKQIEEARNKLRLEALELVLYILDSTYTGFQLPNILEARHRLDIYKDPKTFKEVLKQIQKAAKGMKGEFDGRYD